MQQRGPQRRALLAELVVGNSAMSAADTLYALAFSPDGSHLVGATSRGLLLIWKLASSAATGASTTALALAPPTLAAKLQAHTSTIYSLAFAPGDMLITGSDEEMRGWRWSQLLAGTVAPLFELRNPTHALRRGGVGPLPETNALAVDAAAGLLYSASGDGNAYAWDLSAQSCVATFDAGVGEPLHCLATCPRHRQLVTGGEDGAVRLWDVRTASCAHTLRPDAPPLVHAAPTAAGEAGAPARTGGGGGGGGGWCGCVAVDEAETWLVAGWGDGFLATVELNTLASVACMPTSAAPTAACFLPGSDFNVVSIGSESALYSWRLTGELETRAACSSPTALGLSVNQLRGGAQVVAVGGSAGTVDIFTDTSHRAFTLRAA